ncbi:peptide/nickel transport system substrate-binding protein [Rhizobiales bacterium GAS191]|nr:peptide/nickel transport system substrate-binding protein [Rhizobiales bacterium GAS191]
MKIRAARGILFGLAIFATSADAREVRIAMQGTQVGVSTLDAANAQNSNSALSLLYDTLIFRDGAANYHPHLAKSWDISEDQLVWTFKLRDDVTFHNGKPFTAQTAKWTLDRLKESKSSYFVGSFKDIAVVDDHTLRITLKQPDPKILHNLSLPYLGMLEPESVAALGSNFGIGNAVGTGPFKFQSFAVGLETKLIRNPDYKWGPPVAKNPGPVAFEALTLREFTDDNAAYLEFTTGGLDAMLATPIDYVRRVQDEGAAIVATPPKRLMYMAFNTSKGPLKELAVRDAVAHAIDQTSIRDSVFYGTGLEGHTLLPDSMGAAKVVPEFRISFDPSRAMAKLEEAGWKPGAQGIRAKDGVRLELSLWTANTTDLRRMAEVVQAQLAEVGVKINITTLDATALNEQAKANKHDIILRTYSALNADILDWLWSGERLGYPNMSMWKDRESERLKVAAFQTSKTADEQLKNTITYHEYLLSKYVAAPIFQPITYIAYDKEKIALTEPFLSMDFDTLTALDLKLK